MILLGRSGWPLQGPFVCLLCLANCLGHALLPGNCSGGAIVVMLEVQALALGNLGGVVASKPLLHVIQHGPLSPCTRDDVVLVVIPASIWNV